MKALVTCLFLSVLLLFCSVKRIEGCSTASLEKNVLFGLYNATNGVDWQWLSNEALYGIPWDFSIINASDPCTDRWQGVTCNIACSITDLVLTNYGLNGVLPNGFNGLSQLTTLSLNQNPSLTGPLPSSVTLCTSLTTLSLSSNALTGSLKALTQSSMPSLHTVDVSHNRLNGELSITLGTAWQNIQVLNLGFNLFSGSLPTTLTQCDQLTTLALNDNQFESNLPNDWSTATSLVNVTFANNHFYGAIPTSLLSLRLLESLSANNNNFSSSLPSAIQGNSLQFVNINHNELTGKLPITFASANVLQVLELSSNLIEGSLESIDFSSLQALRVLTIDDNRLTGTLPLTLQEDMSSLQVLSLKGNSLVGPLPVKATSWTALQELSLDNNRFTGSICDSFVNGLSAVTLMGLSYNRLNGSLPNALYSRSSLTSLYLQGNALTGSLSSAIAQLQSLQTLELSDNTLYGNLPSGLSELPLLQTLSVGANEFIGSFPSQIVSNQSQLMNLNLSFNVFTGPIEEQLCHAQLLTLFDLSHNQVSQSLPECVAQSFPLLQYLDLSWNELTNSLPSDWTLGWSTLQSIAMNHNWFTGSLESTLGNVSSLRRLDFSVNLFSYTLPKSISQLHQLESVLLYNNSLSGSLGASTSSLYALRELELQNNYFTGTLTSFVNHDLQAQVEVIVLNNNEFSGEFPMNLFVLPKIVVLSAMQNCLTLSLSNQLCLANETLTVLALDGLSSAQHCQERIMPGLKTLSHRFTAYTLQTRIDGALPTCLFSPLMRSLQSLHLSGNGITGKLPEVPVVNPRLVDLVLSFNQLTGSIPTSFQTHVWRWNFDISHNKLNGQLESNVSHIFANSNSVSLSMDMNRLSGEIPSTLMNANNINILEGNMFSCALEQNPNELPDNDPYIDAYECGSNNVNISLYVWIIVTTLVIVYALLFWYLPRITHFKTKMIKKFDAYWEVYVEQPVPPTQLHIQKLGEVYNHVRRWCITLTLTICIVFFPTNAVLATLYSTYIHTYAWQLSLGYVSGVIPGVVLTIFLMCLLSLLYVRFPASISINVYSLQESIEKSIGRARVQFFDEGHRRLSRFYLSLATVVLLDIALVVVVNMAYVRECSRSSTTAQRKHGLAMTMALFKLLWNKVVFMTFDSKLFRSYVNHEISGGFNDSTVNSIMTTSILGVTLVNNVIAPCIAVGLATSSCFYYAIAQQDDVYASFAWSVSSVTSSGFNPDFAYSVSYPPPFYYNYDCTSALLANYVAIFVYRFILVGFLVPAWKMSLKAIQEWLYHRFKESHWSLHWISIIIPIVLRPITPEQYLTESLVERLKSVDRVSKSHALHEKSLGETLMPTSLTHFPPFSARENVVSIVNDITIILTFGVMFPPLAIVGCVAILSITFFTQIIIGRMCCFSKIQLFLLRYVDFINIECRGLYLLLIRSLLTIPFMIATFWSIFLFDIFGDSLGLVASVWVIPLMTCVPFIIFAINYFTPSYEDDEDESPLRLAARDGYGGEDSSDGFEHVDLEGLNAGIQLSESSSGKSEKERSFWKARNPNAKQTTTPPRASTTSRSTLDQSLLQEAFQYDNPVVRIYSNRSVDIR